MTTTNSRILFPQLPPEIRNEVYSYLSTHDPSSHFTAQFLPFQFKQYNCKHTSVTITPIHYGSKSLLALQQFSFLEAREYYTWLKANDLELHIKVIFRGKVNTFIQADWNKKIDLHLRTLVKQHDWLRKVARYGIQIHWDASDGTLKGRKKEGAGAIPRDMVKAFTTLMDDKVKKNSNVKVKLLLAHRIAVEHVLCGTRFGLGLFLAQSVYDGLERCSIEVWKTPNRVVLREEDVASVHALVVAKSGKMSTAEQILGRGDDTGAGHLLRMRTFRGHDVVEAIWGPTQIGFQNGPDYIISELMKDCQGE
ncbi:hypothetical protein NX059_005664 [Plenodomus lindquistii]|nr:hypothetical protein NX059_005664 [Plenodomus lindquistii]